LSNLPIIKIKFVFSNLLVYLNYKIFFLKKYDFFIISIIIKRKKRLKSSHYDPNTLGYTRVTKVKTKSCDKVILNKS